MKYGKSDKQLRNTSKFISLILRHKPEVLNIELDNHGWTDVETLIARIDAMQPFDMGMLEEIVRTDNKQRYAFNADKTKIRANQGHSVPIDLELVPKTPPEALYHGTGERFVESIDREGLKPMQRQYVHLSGDVETAVKVTLSSASWPLPVASPLWSRAQPLV